MKNGNIIFILIVVAAAMVLGTTFGIINNYKNIATAQKQHSQPSSTTQTTDDAKSVPKSDTNVSESSAVKVNESSGTFTTLSPAETNEVRGMLSALGHSQDLLSASVSSFQQTNNVRITGVLDNTTLNAVVQQFTLKKAEAIVH